MAGKLMRGILGGALLGAAFGYVGGNTAVGIVVCMVAGAIAAWAWHAMETRQRGGR